LLRSSACPGVELLTARHSSRAWRWFHETYTLCLVEQGGSTWQYRGKSHRSEAGTLMLMEPGETHASAQTDPCDFFVLYISPETLERTLGLDRGPHIALPALRDDGCSSAMQQLRDRIEQGGAAFDHEQLLAGLLARVLTLASEPGSRSKAGPEPEHARRAVARAREYLQANLARSVSLDELAQVARMNAFVLLRAFRRQLGLTPIAFQRQQRVHEARRLLVRGYPSGEVAARLGFADQSHLTRVFREWVGVTPGQYALSTPGRAGTRAASGVSDRA
jgi:AraC family transcriptional regulator